MGLLSYFGIKIKPKPKNKKIKKGIQELNEAHKKLMDGIQTDGDFFDADKFVCGQEIFDLIRRLPNFRPADPRVPESGYYNGKPIYIHPACEPNTFMGVKVPKDPVDDRIVYGVPFINSEWELTDNYGRYVPKPYVVPNCNKIQVHTKPSTNKELKILTGIISSLMLGIVICIIMIVLSAI